jgi:hypothetical protein
MGRCYKLFVGDWKPAVVPAADTLFHEPPEWFRLDTAWVEAEGHLVEPDLIRRLPSMTKRQVGRWHTEGKERLLVHWSDGFTGVSLDLRGISGDSLVGRARVLTDALRSSRVPEAKAVARLEPCGSDST